MKQTLTYLFSKVIDRNKNHIAFKYKKNKVWKTINWHNYYKTVAGLQGSLMREGLKKNECACIIAKPSYQWTMTDVAIMSNNSITVPIYKNSLDEDIEYIINNCEAKFIFCEDTALAERINKLDCPTLKKIITFDEQKNKKFASFEQWTSTPDDNQLNDFNTQLLNINEGDTASIIYTSGTTGRPKGVVITHNQLYAEITDIFAAFNFDHQDTSLCFLPLAHVMGRIESLGNIYKPYTIAFAESIEAIKKNIAYIKPTFLIAVPRIFEKIYNGVITQINSKKSSVYIFNWASSVGNKVSSLKMNKKNIPLHLALQYKLANKLIFTKIQQAMGGRIKFALSGGAPLERKISEFFHAANILILEAYGLTETIGGIVLNTPLQYKFGTVGRPINNVDIKIAQDGEILIKSNKVMKEYYKLQEQTDSVFDGDFFKTGDIGTLDDDGFLKITDRKKDLIKTAGGKYVAPQKLENLLKIEPMISNVLIHGDKKKYIVALITVDPITAVAFAKKNSISYSNAESLSQNPALRKYLENVISELNSGLAKHETIKKFLILPKDFTIETGELTPSLKVKRKLCDKKFENELNSLY